MEENAKKINENGKALFEAVRKLGEHFQTLGTKLKSSLEAYNDAVGSLEGNVLVKARKFKELQAANGGEDIRALEPICRAYRRPAVPRRRRGSRARARTVNASYAADLELARRCAAGEEPAWERFVLEYRPVLYRAADALDPTGGARDLADALYADLYSQSLFRYYQGRSSLATWLRAVLSQRYVDRLRAQTALPGASKAAPAIRRIPIVRGIWRSSARRSRGPSIVSTAAAACGSVATMFKS